MTTVPLWSYVRAAGRSGGWIVLALFSDRTARVEQARVRTLRGNAEMIVRTADLSPLTMIAHYAVEKSTAKPEEATGSVTYTAPDGTAHEVTRTFHGRECYMLAYAWGRELAARFNGPDVREGDAFNPSKVA